MSKPHVFVNSISCVIHKPVCIQNIFSVINCVCSTDRDVAQFSFVYVYFCFHIMKFIFRIGYSTSYLYELDGRLLVGGTKIVICKNRIYWGGTF